jgi:thiol-disulfide isomerase/thioredoxin
MNALHVLLLSFASIGAGETVLLDFSSDSCGPCRQMRPIVQQLAAAGHPVREVNTSHDPEMARRHNVQALPTFVMLVDGREVERSVGATSRERLLAMLAKAPAPAREPDAHDAKLTEWQSPASADKLPLRTVSTPLNLYSYPVGQQRLSGGALEQRLLAATARLRVDDSRGARGQTAYSFGTGTIVDAGEGEALILTCAHIFRDSQGKGPIAVDLFCPGGPRGIPGKLIGYDMSRDVALVAVRPVVPVTSVPVAPAGYRPRRGEPVISIGCNRGADPTVQKSHVTDAETPMSPPTTKIAGQPVVGRSGGGLFNGEGQLIGVCYAADPQDNQGYYTALGSVHAELDRTNLSFVYRQRSQGASVESRLAQTRAPELPRELPPNLAAAQQEAAQQLGRKSPALPGALLAQAEYEGLTDAERAVLSAVNSGQVSPQFLQQLAQRHSGQDSQMLTSRRIEQQTPPPPSPPASIPQRLPRSWGE